MRCTLLKIATSFAKCWFLFHLKIPFVTHCLVMLYLNKKRFVQNIDFSSLIGRPCKNIFVDGCLQFYLTQKLFRQHATKRRMRKNICTVRFFAQNLPCVTVIDANFAYVYKFLIQKQFAHGFRGVVKILLRRLFASTFIWKFIFGLTFAMHFQLTARASGMSILPLPPTYVYGVSIKFTHSVHYSGVCPFNNGGIGKKVNDGIFPFYVLAWPTQIFAVFRANFFQNAFFGKPLILFEPLQVLKINRKTRTKVPSFERSANCPLPAICVQNNYLRQNTKNPRKNRGFLFNSGIVTLQDLLQLRMQPLRQPWGCCPYRWVPSFPRERERRKNRQTERRCAYCP